MASCGQATSSTRLLLEPTFLARPRLDRGTCCLGGRWPDRRELRNHSSERVPAREKDACGSEVYARASRYFLGTAVDLQEAYACLPRGRSRSPPAALADLGRAGEPEPLAAADVLGLGVRRGLGVLRGTAHGRARLPGRPGGTPGDARRSAHERHHVALDIGVHLELEIPAGTGWREGERWNAEIAWEFLRAHSSWDEKRLRFELHRYLGWPGQVPSHKLGERI